MIRADRELLAELAQLNSDVVPLAMRIMDQSVTAEEQHTFAERLIAMARQLQARASGIVIDGAVATSSVVTEFDTRAVLDRPNSPGVELGDTRATRS